MNKTSEVIEAENFIPFAAIVVVVVVFVFYVFYLTRALISKEEENRKNEMAEKEFKISFFCLTGGNC